MTVCDALNYELTTILNNWNDLEYLKYTLLKNSRHLPLINNS